MFIDATFRQMFQTGPVRLLSRLGIPHPLRLLPTEYSALVNRRPDWVARGSDGTIYHLEFQSFNDRQMDRRMFDAWYLLERTYGTAPWQIVLYAGEEKMNMPAGFTRRGVRYEYDLVDIRRFSADDLIGSRRLEDNLLSVLCHVAAPGQLSSQLAARLERLPKRKAEDALEKLAVICKLRRKTELVRQLEAAMPIRIDLREFPETYREVVESQAKARSDGRTEGRGEMLRELLEQRFGSLPGWAAKRLASADDAALRSWTQRVLSAKTLREVFAR